METVEDVLSHFGIKGMRWGVRRDRGPDGRVNQGPVSDDARRAAKAHEVARTSGTKALSNSDLKLLNERLNLEQQYSRLTTTPASKKKIGAGGKFVTSLLIGVGRQQAQDVLNQKASELLVKQGLKAVKK